ncbi:MAG: PEGA domain-containing protein [Myxococcales bacterium]|nr:PEGA domain-containing protein [Myxococcales bacterium]MCB9644521.1 PEGA domain-containing protein [Myxococcales bacterium]
MTSRCLVRRCFYVLCCILAQGFFVSPTWSKGTEDVSFYVDTLDDNAAGTAWLEGVWADSLSQRYRSATLSLGGIPEEPSNALKEAEEAFAAGKKAYEELNPEQSFRQFSKAIKHYKAAGAYLPDAQRLAQALLYIGVGYLLNGQRAQGVEAFRHALIFQSKSTLTGISTESDKLQIFRLAQTEVRKLQRHDIKITANTGASVFIDGRFRGTTPLQVSLVEGEHIISVRRQGYARWGKVFRVKGDQAFSASLTAHAKQAAWIKAGKAAALEGSKEQGEFPAVVGAFGKMSQSNFLLLAQVKRIKMRLWIQAAAYDLKNKRQIAAGGAWADWPKGTEVAQELLRSLLRGTPVRLGGWLPGSLGSGPGKPSGGNGLAIALGVTAGVILIGGGVALALYFLSQPRCDNGSCINLTIK